MRPADRLAAFVHEALIAGRSRAEIAAALRDAGWSEGEAQTALAAFAETGFLPPVPRPQPYASAREAFVYGLLFAALATIVWNLTSLSFRIIEYWLPEPGELGWVYGASGMRWSIAVLIVVFPLFAYLHIRAGRAHLGDPAQDRSIMRRWFGYVTLFLAVVGLVGDLVAVVYTFLGGDLTLRFALKAGVVALVALLVLFLFRTEIRDDPAGG